MPALPDPHGLAALALTAFAFFLFTRDRVPIETSSLLILIALILGFQLFPYEPAGDRLSPARFFQGFGHEALVAISALMVIGKGIETTGALRPLAMLMARRWSDMPKLSFLLVLISTAVLSAFLNNTPIVVILLPVLISVAIRNQFSASRILMPMGFATLLGGMSTTIGTSTNLLVVAIAADLGMRRLEMFDFALPVMIAGVAGILYLWLIAPRMLPPREALFSDTSPRIFDAVFHITEGGFSDGKTLSEVLDRTQNKMTIKRIGRGNTLSVTRLPSVTLRAEDRLFVSDTSDNLKEYEQLIGASLHNVSDEDNPVSEERPLDAGAQQLAEVVVTGGSILENWTLRKARFAERYQALVLAIHRAKKPITEAGGDLGDVKLQAGDVLLMQASRDRIEEMKRSGRMLVLDGTVRLPHTHKAPTALGIMFLVIGLAASGVLPISVSALAGVGAMLVTRCISWSDTASALSIPVIMIIVVSLALGNALLATGGIEYAAQLFVAATHKLPSLVILSGLILMVSLITNIVSNNAAAVIGTPIAFSVAQQLGLHPEPFVLAVLFGTNMSYATPIGYQTNLLIFGAGGYQFSDFMKVGIPLTLIMWVAFSLVLPVFYPL
ncbi:MAG: TRAP transporter large permease subunit [Gammaproteobacteria bacterium]|nr:TRAP transporter large permease subunit [Gammaproteobacteria bacterium]